MKTEVTLNIKEQKRLKVLNEVEAGRMKMVEAGEMLGLSVRQVQRLRRAYREKGAAGLAHGNRGKVSARRTPGAIRQRVVELAKGEYVDYNDQQLTEKLAEKHGVVLSRSAVRSLRRAAGLSSPRPHRAPQHRSRRERRPTRGMMLQADGSDHAWLEERGPRLCLIAYIDDATSEVPAALFREEEDAAGYMLGLQQVGLTHGLPLSLYADRHTIFRSPKEATLEQQLAGKEPKSQFGRALDELGITYIAAQSPQAKGRIERLFETLQDRLVKELREANACTRDEANVVLARYLPRLNRQFAKTETQPGNAYREWPADLRPDSVLCFKYTRTVANDNTISFDGHTLQIPPGPQRRSYARARVEVRLHLDGHLTVHHHAQQIATFQPAQPGPVRADYFNPLPQPRPTDRPTPSPKPSTPAPRRSTAHTPAPNHPWRHSPVGKAAALKSPG